MQWKHISMPVSIIVSISCIEGQVGDIEQGMMIGETAEDEPTNQQYVNLSMVCHW